MKIEETIMIEYLMEYAKRNDYFNLTTREFAELDSKVSKALEKQIELNDYLNTLRKNKKYQIYDILSEFALEVEHETNNKWLL